MSKLYVNEIAPKTSGGVVTGDLVDPVTVHANGHVR